MAEDQPLISACLIVRDEEANISKCLASLTPLVDEIVAVDTGSIDATVQLLEEHGARVRHEPWAEDFAKHRNQSLEMATSRWILIIDADEVVESSDLEETRARLASNDLPDVLLVKVHMTYPGGRVLSMAAPRLFRRAAGLRYMYTVHEQLDLVNAPAAMSNLTLFHSGYEVSERLIQKETRNLRLAERMEPHHHALHCVVRAAFALGEWSKAMEAATALADDCEASPRMRLEACAMGVAASFNVRDTERLSHLLATGIAIAPNDPDILLMNLLASIAKYLHSLKDGDSTQDRIYLRPWLFHHQKAVVRDIYAQLLGATARDTTSKE